MTIQGQNPVTDATAMTNQAASSSTSTATPPATDPTAKLANENTFLQLLVAQIKNQDPTNPTDSVQFLSQLAQFSQLEQLIGIRQELQPGRIVDGDHKSGHWHHRTKELIHELFDELIIEKRRLKHVFYNTAFRTRRE